MTEASYGHWRLGFRGSKAAIVEIYEYVVSARRDFYGKDYPDFVRDFLETKQFFAVREGGPEPCRLEDCADSDQMILRGHSVMPGNVGKLEEADLFFDFVDDMPISSQLEAAYCTWPQSHYGHGDWLVYFEPGSSDRVSFQIDFDLTEENIPKIKSVHPYDDEFSPSILDILGLKAEKDFQIELGLENTGRYDGKPAQGRAMTASYIRYRENDTIAAVYEGAARTGQCCFRNAVTRVQLPESLAEIDYRAFAGCAGLTEWVLPPESKFYSDQGALIEKESGRLVCWPSAKGEAVIPAGVREIGNGAFFGCQALTGVTIPEGVTAIGFSAFEGCSHLAHASIPGSVTQIKALAFADCANLAQVSFAEGLETIEEHAFSGCAALAGVSFPESLREIGAYAFSHCRSLTSVAVPQGAAKLWRGVFAKCAGLTQAQILSKPAVIPDNLFDGCEKLTEVSIAQACKSVGECSFLECESLAAILAPKTPIGKFKREGVQPQAALGFALLAQRQVRMTKSIQTGYLNYIRKNRKELYDLAGPPPLLELMTREGLIPEEGEQ